MTFEEAIRLIKKGDAISLRHALDEGLDPNTSNHLNSTILMLAAMEGNTAMGRLLIGRGADVNRENNLRDTALTLAAMLGHAAFVKLLLDSGASTERIRERGALDSFLDWVERYCKVSDAEMRNLRLLLMANDAKRTDPA